MGFLMRYYGELREPLMWRLGMQPWALSLPDKELCLREALAVCCMDVRVGLQRKLSTEELMLLNCGVGEDS